MVRTITAAVAALQLLVVVAAVLLAACGESSPGPLAGTWISDPPVVMKTTFRKGETESMGVVEQVDYKVDGKSVLVTFKNGMAKGTTMRFVVVNPTTLQAGSMVYRKAS